MLSFTMRGKFLLSLLCFGIASATTFAQSDSITVGTKSDGTPLRAAVYTSTQLIEEFSISQEGEHLCIDFRETSKNGKYLKNKGEIGFYDLKRHTLLWKSPINYLNTRSACLDRGVLLSKNGKVWLLDKENGTKQWETKLNLVRIEESQGVLLGYRSAGSNKLCAIDLNTGQALWEQKMPHQYGWSRVKRLEDGQLLIVADDLHRLNVLTGEMQTFKSIPGAQDTKAALLQGLTAAMVGVAGGIAGGFVFYSYMPTGNNIISHLCSNTLVHEGRCYWADRKQIVCLDSAMNVVWQREFPEMKAGYSDLFMLDNKLYMLSYGYGLRPNGSRKKYGRPFIACYDPQEGTEEFFNPLSMKKDIVEDALWTKNALYMLFDDGLAYQEFTDSVVNITPWDTKQHGRLSVMKPDTIYAANDDRSVFTPLFFDGEHCPVYNEHGALYEIDKDLNISNSYQPTQLYPVRLRLRDYLCVGNRNDFHFIHRIGMPVARMPFAIRKGKVLGNKLLMLDTNGHLLFLDMDEVVK